jgi:hypothetical protein
MLRAPHPRTPRRRRRTGNGHATAGAEVATDDVVVAGAPAGRDQ